MDPKAATGHSPSEVEGHHHLHSGQSHPLLRNWQTQTAANHSPSDFVLPLFIVPDEDEIQEIGSLPGVKRFGPAAAVDHLRPLIDSRGLASVLLFPVMGAERGLARATCSSHNPVLRLIPRLRKHFPELLIITDVCLCAFTEHGHCCVFDERQMMDNAASLRHLAELSLAYAKAGAHVVAPSDMMDGRVGAIRAHLSAHGHQTTGIMSYAAKFASCFYGPFREAAGSAPKFGDRQCYQLPGGSKGMAMRAARRDADEGADFLMVKPSMAYLDLVADIHRAHAHLPLAVYQVSGEYAMLHHGAAAGAFDLQSAVREVMTSYKRAGASIIISYFTPLILDWLKE